MRIIHCSINNCNADSGKSLARLCIRISGLPANVVTPVIDPGKLRIYGRERLSFRARDLKIMTGTAALTGKTRILNTRLAGGVLTFAPTAAIDLFNNFSGSHFNGRQFVIDEAKSQPGNAAAFATGEAAIWIAPRVAVALFGAGTAIGTAPLLLIGIGVGIIAQIVWKATGLNEKAGRLIEKAMDKGSPVVDFKYISP